MKLNMNELEAVNGGYIFNKAIGEYEIIDDNNGQVLFVYKTPCDKLHYYLTESYERLIVRGMAIAKGQSPRFIRWAKLNELRGY